MKREEGRIWHWLDAPELPGKGVEVAGELDWAWRHLLMRTQTVLHMLCGVVWSEFAIPITGGNMEPGSGRLDFPVKSISAELGRRIGNRINEEPAAARAVVVEFLGPAVADAYADADSALVRTAANPISTADPARHSAGRQPPKPSTNTHARLNTIRRCDDRLSPGSTRYPLRQLVA
ncbi:alanyl-tRNA editing protein [Pseudonocardia charpentierae]|uniref:Uncharacterized protein n=1 Tax=Pseudonocardia charpentierae TaxID=3075545 RepID=A0ABU2NJP5_9PSEU|nr:hypothetical protein [Pseudonocardia sp. DSM 45834]MDT0353429.1 hypothetical protein [Pseudonocardia sp. DSM 45834]